MNPETERKISVMFEKMESWGELKGQVTMIRTDTEKIVTDLGKVRGDVSSLQSQNADLERRIRALEEGRGRSGGYQDDYEWCEAIEFARRVVVFYPVYDFPESNEARVEMMTEIFKKMGMDSYDIRRYQGMKIYRKMA